MRHGACAVRDVKAVKAMSALPSAVRSALLRAAVVRRLVVVAAHGPAWRPAHAAGDGDALASVTRCGHSGPCRLGLETDRVHRISPVSESARTLGTYSSTRVRAPHLERRERRGAMMVTAGGEREPERGGLRLADEST